MDSDRAGSYPVICDWNQLYAAYSITSGYANGRTSERQFQINQALYRELHELAVQIVTDPRLLEMARKAGILHELAEYLANMFEGQDQAGWDFVRVEHLTRRRELLFALDHDDLKTAQKYSWANICSPDMKDPWDEQPEDLQDECADIEAICIGEPLPNGQKAIQNKRRRGRPRKQVS